MMAFQAFQEKTAGRIVPIATAGHSLGEFSALVAASVLTFEQAAQLVADRANLMEQATEGTMAAVIGLSAQAVQVCLSQQVLPEGQLVVVANDNAPTQVVISGTAEGIEVVTPALKAAGAKRVLPLPVGGAFHSPLMAQAGQVFAQHVENQPFLTAQMPVVCNVNAVPTTDEATLKTNLKNQLCGGVQWTNTLTTLVETLGVERVIEFGPGKVLTGLVKKQYPQVDCFNIFDMPSLEATVAGMAELTKTVVGA
jgi:[acyl-carrier-protein] S-malonyltransferase